MMKTVTVLGSTGSIGRQTLEVASHLGMKVVALTAYNNKKLFDEQVGIFKPDIAVLGSEPGGDEAIIRAAEHSGADVIVTAIAGQAGLDSTLAATKTGKRIALANKEALVCGGEMIMESARRHNTEIIPVDSEHSAIFQCLAETRQRFAEKRCCHTQTNEDEDNGFGCGDEGPNQRFTGVSGVKKIILTASGGPFRGYSREQLEKVTVQQALQHPNWNMGQKVTIDSATMMNKGLEFIEAMHLFSVTPGQIEVVVHPESIVHSMVEFADGSTIAQLSNPDMRMPIQYALTYPKRCGGLTKPPDLVGLGALTFEKPDFDAFPCLRLAMEAARRGTRACQVLNNANEEAVKLFIAGKIAFTDIPKIIEKELA